MAKKVSAKVYEASRMPTSNAASPPRSRKRAQKLLSNSERTDDPWSRERPDYG